MLYIILCDNYNNNYIHIESIVCMTIIFSALSSSEIKNKLKIIYTINNFI